MGGMIDVNGSGHAPRDGAISSQGEGDTNIVETGSIDYNAKISRTVVYPI
jgi:hypothetical protein